MVFMILALHCSAQTPKDSTKTVTIGEVTVTATNQRAIDYGVSYTPTQMEKKHAATAVDLLGQMMISGLRVNPFDGKVETSWGREVHYFIDGQEAQEWQIKSLRPKEVARVEYLLSPPQPQYKQYQAVINFVLRQYAYGGYVYLSGEQGALYNNGDYSLSGKLKKGRMTWMASTGVWYDKEKDIREDEDVTFIYDDGSSITKITNGIAETSNNTYYGMINGNYTHGNLILNIDGGLKYSDRPDNNSFDRLEYIQGDKSEPREAITTSWSDNLVPYFNSQFQLNGLPKNSILFGGGSFSYNRNHADTDYRLENENLYLQNGYNENGYIYDIYAGYMFPIYKQNYLTLQGRVTMEKYSTDYHGTDNTHQHLTNNNYTLFATYTHRFSDTWSGTLMGYTPIQSIKINNLPSRTTPYLNVWTNLNGRFGTKHSLYAAFSITQSPIRPSYYNSVVRQDSELEGTKGNADLKTVRQVYALVSYTWMASNQFSLNAAVQWDNITNDIVPWWHPVDGLMVCEMINSGNFNPLSFSISPYLYLWNRKLSVTSKFNYIREWHNGLYKVDHGYLGIFPSIYI